ncbi:MAG TPA: hypothetical protein VMC09_08045 [Anaerolineales bacterium]|nr:hypothetical protein [Anaerolineales bacterium]
MFAKRALTVFLIGLLAFAFASIVYAYAATNTVDLSKAGDGVATVSGYHASNVTYTVGTANPADITSVAFDLDGTGTTVEVRFAAGGTLYNCSNGGSGTHYSCTITPNTVSVTSINSLEVVAAQ